MTKEKKKNTPVFDLPVLPVPSVSDVTQRLPKTDPYLPCHPLPANSPTAGDKTNIVYRPAADQKASWEKHLIPLTPEQQILWHLGFEKWRESGEKIYEKFRRHKAPLMPCYASIFQHSMLNLCIIITMHTKLESHCPLLPARSTGHFFS